LTRRATPATALGGRAGELLGQHGRPDSTPARRVERVLHRDVVVDQHGLDRDAFVGGVLGGQLEVHHVARVVLDEVHDAGAAVHGLGRGEHLVGHRGGEHLAGAGGVEHAEADEAAVQRLVARAAAGDQGDLARPRRVGAHDDLRFVFDAQDVPVRGREADERVLDRALGVVEELAQRLCLGGHVGSSHFATAAGAEVSGVVTAVLIGRATMRGLAIRS
jgi:hypothetical protein